MGELELEILKLHEKTERTLLQFLNIEVRSGWTAIEMGEFELTRGNEQVTQSEVASVEKVLSALERFIPELPIAQQPEFQRQTLELKAALDSLKSKLRSSRPD